MQVTEGVGTLPTLGADDPAYAGWTRLAVVERQYVVDPDRSYSPPVESVTVFAGAVAAPLGSDIPHGAFPFEDGSTDVWWWPDAPPPSIPPRLPLGRIVRLTRASDWLGSAFVLLPPPEIHRYFGLEAARYAGPLVWTDSSSVPAIALRTWRVRNEEALWAEPVACEGADLVVRPDIFERLSGLYRVSLRELRVVWRRPITVDPAED
jgi:hypothetical protein